MGLVAALAAGLMFVVLGKNALAAGIPVASRPKPWVPAPAAQAPRLLDLGHPARYGRGEQTLIDPTVRDTWQVPRELGRQPRPPPKLSRSWPQ